MKIIPRELLNDSSAKAIEMIKIGKNVAMGMATVALATATLMGNQAHANMANSTSNLQMSLTQTMTSLEVPNIQEITSPMNLENAKYGNAQAEVKFMTEGEYKYENNALYQADLACVNDDNGGYKGALLGNVSLTQNGAIYVVKGDGDLTNVYGNNIVANSELQSNLDALCNGQSHDYRIGFQINASDDVAMKFDVHIDNINHFGSSLQETFTMLRVTESAYMDIDKMQEPSAYYYSKEVAEERFFSELKNSQKDLKDIAFKYDYSNYEAKFAQIMLVEGIDTMISKVDMTQDANSIVQQLNEKYEIGESKKIVSDYLKYQIDLKAEIDAEVKLQMDYPEANMDDLDGAVKNISGTKQKTGSTLKR